jgi:hypothetical protein
VVEGGEQPLGNVVISCENDFVDGFRGKVGHLADRTLHISANSHMVDNLRIEVHSARENVTGCVDLDY